MCLQILHYRDPGWNFFIGWKSPTANRFNRILLMHLCNWTLDHQTIVQNWQGSTHGVKIVRWSKWSHASWTKTDPFRPPPRNPTIPHESPLLYCNELGKSTSPTAARCFACSCSRSAAFVCWSDCCNNTVRIHLFTRNTSKWPCYFCCWKPTKSSYDATNVPSYAWVILIVLLHFWQFLEIYMETSM